MQAVRRIAQNFLSGGTVSRVEPLGNGLVNDTYLVKSNSDAITSLVLQKLNRNVFRRPDWVMANLSNLVAYVETAINHGGLEMKLRLPRIHLTQDAKSYFIDDNDDYWRALEYIPNTRTLEAIRNECDAEQIGFALGQFHHLIADMDTISLHDTLPGFHDCPRYFSHFKTILPCVQSLPDSAELSYGIEFINARKSAIGVLEEAKASGHLAIRTIHGDPKINNILFDVYDQKAVSIIDLDTVKPGLFQYDIGDCLRSACNRQTEDAECSTVHFDVDICRLILKTYLSATAAILTESDTRYLYNSIHLLPLELGLRYLTDYLEGNRYFKVDFPEHNLFRALVQFHLTASIEQQENQIRGMIAELVSHAATVSSHPSPKGKLSK